MKTPEAIPEWIKGRFNTVINASVNGHAALVSAFTKEGEQVWLVTAIVNDGDDYVITPIGHLVCPENPYEYYADPGQEEAA